MEITLKFKKNTKAGKTLLDILEAYVRNNKDIEMIRPYTQDDLNEESLQALEEASKGIGVSEPKDVEDFIKDLKSW